MAASPEPSASAFCGARSSTLATTIAPLVQETLKRNPHTPGHLFAFRGRRSCLRRIAIMPSSATSMRLAPSAADHG